MKITKSRLKEIIKEELSLMDSSKEQALEEGLLDNAIQRLRAAVAQVPEEDREELQDVLASIAQLGDRAPDALKAAAHAKAGLTPEKPTSPGIRYTEGDEDMQEMSRHDPDSGYDELRQQKDDGDWDVLDDEEEAAREKERAKMRRAAAERNR